MVITCENNGFITRGLRPLVINLLFSLVMTITIHKLVVKLHVIRTKENKDRSFERDFAKIKLVK